MTEVTWLRVPSDALNLPEVAERLRLAGVFPDSSAAALSTRSAVNVVKAWRRLGKLCPPDGVVFGIPWWRPKTVDRWQLKGGHEDRRYGPRARRP